MIGDMKYNLPRGYLSSSACDLWETNPNAYREKYYLHSRGFDSPYTDFGKWFADDIEKYPAKYPNIPKGDIGEFPVKWTIEGVPVLGYLDSFCTKTKTIFEYKTSIVKGSDSWNQVKVQKWKQLPFYAMCIHSMFGKYHPVIKLVVMQTEWADICKETRFGTRMIVECDKKLQFASGSLDGPVIYERTIELWEVKAMKQRLVRIATEISTDYTQWQLETAKV